MLRHALASVRLQSYPDIEHIVIDGGSTDATRALLEAAEDRWGVDWVSEPDGGMYEALNRGLTMANGDIVTWVNSDDLLLPWAVEAAVDHMLTLGEPHAVFSDVLSTTQSWPPATPTFYGRFNRKSLATLGTLAQPTVYWPRRVTEAIGALDTSTYRQIADCEYWLRMSGHIPFSKVREISAVVINHPHTKRQSLSGQIASEFGALRQQYSTVAGNSPTQKINNAIAWRRELGAFTSGHGWHRTLASPLLNFGELPTNASLTTAIVTAARRHPYKGFAVDIQRFREALEVTLHELD